MRPAKLEATDAEYRRQILNDPDAAEWYDRHEKELEESNTQEQLPDNR